MVILSHNAFWFQGVPFQGVEPPLPRPEILAGLRDLYLSCSPDIICLQEVQSAEAFRLVSSSLRMDGAFAPGNMLPQYGTAIFRTTGSSTDYKTWTDLGLSPVRSCILAGNTPLSIACAHLPSGRQLGPEKAARQRREELLSLLRTAPPDILCGDLNECPDGSVSQALSDAGYSDVVLEFLGNVPTTPGGGRGDYIWVRNSLLPLVSRVEVPGRDTLSLDDRLLSDHFPIVMELEV